MDGSRPRVLYALPQSQTMLHKMDVLNIYSSVVASKDGGRKGGREALQRPSLELRESLGEWGGRFVLKSGAIPKPRFCFQDTAAQQLHFDHLLCALNDGLGHLSQEASSPREMNRVSCAASCVATLQALRPTGYAQYASVCRSEKKQRRLGCAGTTYPLSSRSLHDERICESPQSMLDRSSL
jgi:hypothetical protein